MLSTVHFLKCTVKESVYCHILLIVVTVHTVMKMALLQKD